MKIPPTNSSSIDDSSLPTVASSFLQYDMEWLAILKKTHHLLTINRGAAEIPRKLDPPSDIEIKEIEEIFSNFPFGANIPPTDLGVKEQSGKHGVTLEVGDTNEVLKILKLNHNWMESYSYRTDTQCDRRVKVTSTSHPLFTSDVSKNMPSTDPCEVCIDDIELS